MASSSADPVGHLARGPADVRQPLVSVIVPSLNGLPYPLVCLEALATQDSEIPMEIIVPDCTGPDTVVAINDRFPSVKVLTFDEPRTVAQLRAAGIEVAAGRLVAVTEDHCLPRPDWIRNIVEAHRQTGWAAVGGGVENDSTDRIVDWAAFFCEYHHHISPVPPGPTRSVPGMNVAYDMEALASERGLFAESLWENFLHDRLHGEGFVLGLDPKIVVGHRKRFTVRGFLTERFHNSRAFSGLRVAGSPRWVRTAWAAASLLLPPLLLFRMTREIARRPAVRGRYLRALPLVVLFTLAWTVGELVGYLMGPGDSPLKVR